MIVLPEEWATHFVFCVWFVMTRHFPIVTIHEMVPRYLLQLKFLLQHLVLVHQPILVKQVLILHFGVAWEVENALMHLWLVRSVHRTMLPRLI